MNEPIVRFLVRSSSLLLSVAFLVSCHDEGVDLSNLHVGGEGYVAGPLELGGVVNAVNEKGLYPAMETAIESGEQLWPGTFFDQPWFAMNTGDRVRLLEVDPDQEIGRVEVLNGFAAGRTGWVSLLAVKFN